MRVCYIKVNNILKYRLHIKAIIIISPFLLWILRILHYFTKILIYQITSLLRNIVEINKNQSFIVSFNLQIGFFTKKNQRILILS